VRYKLALNALLQCVGVFLPARSAFSFCLALSGTVRQEHQRAGGRRSRKIQNNPGVRTNPLAAANKCNYLN
jgi:hypothetical protein